MKEKWVIFSHQTWKNQSDPKGFSTLFFSIFFIFAIATENASKAGFPGSASILEMTIFSKVSPLETLNFQHLLKIVYSYDRNKINLI